MAETGWHEMTPLTATLPTYDRAALKPGIVHIGLGNFHRAHMAVYLDDLFAMGEGHDWAILGAGVREGDARMRDALKGQDCLSTVIELDPSGRSARRIGAMVDFIEVHAFGCMPKSPNPLVDPLGYDAEIKRLRKAYAEAYGGFFRDYLPENGVPARFTVHVLDVPDQAASYEFYSTALYQKSLQK